MDPLVALIVVVMKATLMMYKTKLCLRRAASIGYTIGHITRNLYHVQNCNIRSMQTVTEIMMKVQQSNVAVVHQVAKVEHTQKHVQRMAVIGVK